MIFRRQFTIRATLILIALLSVPFALLHKYRGKFREMENIGERVEAAGGASDWIPRRLLSANKSSDFTYVYTVETVHAREFWRGILEDEVLHLQLPTGFPNDKSRFDLLNSDHILSIELDNWCPDAQSQLVMKNLKFVSVESESQECLNGTLRALAGCVQIEWLSIDAESVNNQALKLVAALPNLRTISINSVEPPCADLTLVHLQSLRRLNELHIFGCDQIDFKMANELLVSLRSLTYLHIEHNSLTEQEVSELEARWPMIQLEFGEKSKTSIVGT